MKITLLGAPNARDLGGMQTAFGTVKERRLLRSGELSRLTAEDVTVLQSVPLRRIVDLRTLPEQQNSPDVEIPDVQKVDVSIIRATTFGITYEKSSGDEIAAMLQAGFARMQSRRETYAQHMVLLYKNFVNDSHSRNGYGEFLKLLANKPVEGATLWHCTMGKDRVGTCTALLLHCLGASRKQIFDDYLLTNDMTAQNRASIFAKLRGHVSEENMAVVESMLLADKSYLEAFFDEIEKSYGSMDAFLTECGISETDKQSLRKNYLD